MRIVIKLKSDANSNVVLNKLYKMTQMQASFAVNNVALVNGRPKTLNLKQILQAFIDHRHDVVTRRTQFRAPQGRGESPHPRRSHHSLAKHRRGDRHNQGQRQSGSRPRCPLRALRPLEPQTAAIVAMRLGQLTGLEQDKLHNDYDEIMAEIKRLKLILEDDSVCRNLIKEELIEIRDKYGDDRRTDIDYTAGDFNAEDFYADDDMIITISHLGYIKRTPLSEFRAQNRGGMEPADQ